VGQQTAAFTMGIHETYGLSVFKSSVTGLQVGTRLGVSLPTWQQADFPSDVSSARGCSHFVAWIPAE